MHNNGGHHWIIEGNTFQWANSICLSVGGGGGPAAGGVTTSHIIRGNTMRYSSFTTHFRTEEIRIISGPGGTARDNKVYNNIFLNTGESALNFENEHNEADRNLYAGVPGGYLRVLRPGRPELLNISAAREYYRWEKNGQTGSMQLSLDPRSLHLTFSMTGDITKVKTFNGASVTHNFFGVSAGDARMSERQKRDILYITPRVSCDSARTTSHGTNRLVSPYFTSNAKTRSATLVCS